MNILTGVLQYLIDRNVQAKLYGSYVEVVRNKSKISICLFDNNLTTVECFIARRASHGNNRNDYTWRTESSRKIDLADPDSLQAIYELVMSRKNR